MLVVAVERQVQARLKPGRRAVHPFGHAVERLVRHDRAGKRGIVHTLGREVVVPGQVECPDVGQSAVLHLDFITPGQKRDLE